MSMPRKSKHCSHTKHNNERVSQIYDEVRAIPRKSSKPYTRVLLKFHRTSELFILCLVSNVTLLLYGERMKKTHARFVTVWDSAERISPVIDRSQVNEAFPGDNKNIGAYIDPSRARRDRLPEGTTAGRKFPQSESTVYANF